MPIVFAAESRADPQAPDPLGSTLNIPDEPVTIAGIPIGQPFKLKECRTDKFGLPVDTRDKPCWERPYEHQIGKRRDYEILWPNDNRPLGATSVHAFIDKNRLVGISLGTSGVLDQTRVLQALEEKFGPPTSLERRRVENAFGAKFDTYLASWSTSKISVVFQGMYEFDKGYVLIETPGEAARRQRQMQAVQPPKL